MGAPEAIASSDVERELKWVYLKAQLVFEYEQRWHGRTRKSTGDKYIVAYNNWSEFSSARSFKKVPENLTVAKAAQWGFQGHSIVR